MITNTALITPIVNEAAGAAAPVSQGWLQLFYAPPPAIIQLLVVVIVSWAFRHVVDVLSDRLKQGNGAHISVMLCMSLMWVYGFVESSIQQGIKPEGSPDRWWCFPILYACAGSVFMLVAMWLYIKGRSSHDGNQDEPVR